jgi:hypothetical protein
MPVSMKKKQRLGGVCWVREGKQLHPATYVLLAEDNVFVPNEMVKVHFSTSGRTRSVLKKNVSNYRGVDTRLSKYTSFLSNNEHDAGTRARGGVTVSVTPNDNMSVEPQALNPIERDALASKSTTTDRDNFRFSLSDMEQEKEESEDDDDDDIFFTCSDLEDTKPTADTTMETNKDDEDDGDEDDGDEDDDDLDSGSVRTQPDFPPMQPRRPVTRSPSSEPGDDALVLELSDSSDDDDDDDNKTVEERSLPQSRPTPQKRTSFVPVRIY